MREAYRAAAGISIGELARVLDRIEEKVEAGEVLSPDEKALRAELYAIKSRMERSLEDFWVNNFDR